MAGSGLIVPGTSRRAFLGSGLKLGAMGVTAALGSALVLGQAKPAAAESGYQHGWRYCNKCNCLFYNPSDAANVGLCAAGGGHNGQWRETNPSSNRYYVIHDWTSDNAQGGWAYCNQCQSMHYAPGNGWCPGRGHHAQGVSLAYSIFHSIEGYDSYQTGWRYCNKCRNLAYLGTKPCAAGGTHYLGGSLDYGVDYTL